MYIKFPLQIVATTVALLCFSSSSLSKASTYPLTGFKGMTIVHSNKRDASTLMSGGDNNEGEAHSDINPPSGSTFTSIDVGKGGESIAAYWTKNPNNDKATQAYIMIHGKLRDGDTYWTTMDNILSSAVKDNVDGVDKNAIVVAPEFFSTIYNSGQYSKNELAWGDVNSWQAGDIATFPNGTTLTSFDALDALVDEFTNSTKYPAMKNVTVVGHGGGGQLGQRYAMVAKNAPTGLHIRYIHGDASSCAYFTNDRPSKMADGDDLPSKSSCEYYNTWRYGFDNFTGTADGKKTPQQYFQQYISRDVISIVGLQDTAANGDTYCMAQMQGGSKRRDRNLSWWQYINTLAGTNEDLTGFPATFNDLPDWSNISGKVIQTQLIVVEDADHDAELVFGSDEGRAALFSTAKMPTGWRPDGWVAKPSFATNKTSSSSSSSSSKSGNKNNPSTSSNVGASSSATLSFAVPLYMPLLLLPALHLLFTL